MEVASCSSLEYPVLAQGFFGAFLSDCVDSFRRRLPSSCLLLFDHLFSSLAVPCTASALLGALPVSNESAGQFLSPHTCKLVMENPVRVLHVVNSLEPGGMENGVVNIARGL